MTARIYQLCRNLAARRGAGVFSPSFHLGGRSCLTNVPRFSNLISKSQQQQQQWRSGRRNWLCSLAPASQEAELQPSNKSLPWLMLPPEEIPGEDEEEEEGGCGIHKKTVNLQFLDPTTKKVMKLEKRKVPKAMVNGHCAGSSGNWLFYLSYDDYGHVGIYMVNLFSSPSSEAACAETIALPSVFTLPRLVSFTAKAKATVFHEGGTPSTNYELSYNFQAPPEGGSPSTNYKILSYNFRNDDGDLSSYPPETMAGIGIRKVAMSTSSSLTMLVICGPESRLAFCKPGESTSWTPLESPIARRGAGYLDVIYSSKKKLFLALTRGGCIEAWDLPDNPFSPKEKMYLDYHGLRIYIETMHEYYVEKHGLSEYLVESGDGSILHVTRYHRRHVSRSPGDETEIYRFLIKPEETATYSFSIYELDFKKRKGSYVPSLGEEALFLGSNQSFALAVSDYPASKLMPNSIYFSDDDDPIRGHANVGGDMGIFNLKSERVSSLYSTDSKRIIPRPLWVVPPPRSA